MTRVAGVSPVCAACGAAWPDGGSRCPEVGCGGSTLLFAQVPGAVELAERASRAEGERDDALAEAARLRDRLRHESARAAEVGELRGLAERRRGELIELAGRVEEERQRADRAEAALAAQGVPHARSAGPSDEEIAAHAAAGGSWLVRAEWRAGRQMVDRVQSWAPRMARLIRDAGSATWWLPLDANDVPCAWPVARAEVTACAG